MFANVASDIHTVDCRRESIYLKNMAALLCPSMLRRSKWNYSMSVMAVVVGLVLTMSFLGASGTELTFELPDNDLMCFYEEIESGTSCSLEYQVISGGNYDVDATLYGPNKKVIYQGQRKQYDSVDFTTESAGEYHFCFSNEFSSFTHKVVYFDMISGDDPPLTDNMGEHDTALTQLEMSTVKIHEALKLVRDYQTHHRLREATGRDMAEFLGERVQYWSIGETSVFVLVGLATVFILRRFFADKRSAI